MKGQYAGRQPGATEGGERVLLWATIVKTHDVSNHVVHCAGETFTPASQAMSDAEPTAAELRQAATAMAVWERQEAERLEAEDAEAQAEERDKQRKAEEAKALADLESSTVMKRVKAALVSALKGEQAP